ncbi:hypothetical protein LZ480_09325 [Solibacillus sp. MA9]|uniref:YtkA-like domain-containing protein n=1 Tax=Solibacillus palustris TaxID=2908203 RepID=A0ABS9UCQ2_9BACL|nr:hypothetical protein [Solibacillus sp. MA9]MCH7322094.1 hypothetical protein [Solibacillus sp. MA9]
MRKNIGIISYMLILVLFLLSMGLTNSIAAENETKDNNITWDLNNIETSASTEEFVITEYVDELKLDKIKQSTTSESKRLKAKIEYRLLKLDYKGSFIDTGIYNILEGSKGKNKSDGNLYGSISPGTYKINITNLNDEDIQVHSERILVD